MGSVVEGALVGQTVADAMIHWPKVCPRGTTVADARDLLLNPKVHVLLVVSDGVLVSVVDRDDLVDASSERLAESLGRLEGRVVSACADLDAVTASMTSAGQRRVAVVDDAGRLVGLLCGKRSGRGFCTDAGVAARAAERVQVPHGM